MNLVLATLVTVALQLPPPWYGPKEANPETPEQYRARVATIVQAAEEEARLVKNWPWDPSTLATLALIQTYEESKFRLSVHDGTRLGDKGRSRCLGQVKVARWLPRKDWLATTGTSLEATRNCMRAVMRYLSVHRARCARHMPFGVRSIAGTLSGYGTGHSCFARWANNRARKVLDAYWRAFHTLGAKEL